MSLRRRVNKQQSTGEHAGQLVSAWSKANDVANASVFLTPAYMTPFASTTVRLNPGMLGAGIEVCWTHIAQSRWNRTGVGGSISTCDDKMSYF